MGKQKETKPDDPKQTRANIIETIFKTPDSKEHTLTEAENAKLLIAEWLDKKHLRMKTRYTKRQVMAVSTLQSLADTYKIKTLQRFLDEFRMNKLSEDGKSSQELENILKSRMPQMEETQIEKLSKYLE